MEEPGKRFAAMMSGLDIHYGMGTGQGMRHPLLVRRMPDLDLVTASGRLRTFALLRDARPVLLNLGAFGAFDITGWAKRVRMTTRNISGNGSFRCGAWPALPLRC